MSRKKAVTAILEETFEMSGAELIRIACQFQSRILLKNGSRQVNAKSMMGVMAFGLTDRMEIEIDAEGEDEQKALEAIEDFLTGNCRSEKKERK